MKSIFSKLNWIGKFFRLLNISNRDIVIACVLAFLFSCLEGFGVALLLPVLQFVEKGQAVFAGEHVNVFWRTIAWISAHTGLPVNLPLLLIFTFTVILTRGFVLYAKTVQAAFLEFRGVEFLRNKLFQNFVGTDYAFCEKNGEASFSNSLTTESLRVGRIIFFFFQCLTSVFGLIFYLIILCFLSVKLTILALITFVLMQLFLMKRIRATKIAGQEISKGNKNYNFFITQKIAAAKLIRIFNTQDVEKEKFLNLTDQLVEKELIVQKRVAFVQSQLDPILILGAFAVMYVGSDILKMSITTIGVFLLVLLRMFPFSKTANNTFQQMLAFKPALDNIENQLLNAVSFNSIQSGSIQFSTLKNSIEFQNVEFAYQSGLPVLQDINLKWPMGNVLALVGHSGSGKSTIVDLLLRIREVTAGQIKVDGKNIKEYDLATLRKAIGYVSQDTFLFNDTVYNNIIYGRSGVTEKDVVRACRLSHCYEFIQQMPLALQSKVGDRGASFSGGERQRICLARALVNNPDILILDEPTSALDSESERLINLTLQELKTMGKTILIIAHRFSTVQEANQILVLDKGRIVEVGTHIELMEKKNSVYNYLYNLQNTK